MALGVVILAAGDSSRMGQPKMLLPWCDTTILGHLLKTWHELDAAQIAVVINPQHAGIQAELERLAVPRQNWIPNAKASDGMFSSIQAAARWGGWDPGIAHFAILLGDQPHLKVELLRSLKSFAAQNLQGICQPAYQGRARHPVILSAGHFRALTDSNCGTLKDFLQSQAEDIKLMHHSDPALNFDIDTPEDYERARRLYQ